MKLRDAAALALVGWYLMVPRAAPFRLSGGRFLPDIATGTSLSEWSILGSYDSASRCVASLEVLAQKGRGKLRSIPYHEYTSAELLNDEHLSRQLTDHYNSLRWLNAKCIATDNPRLKEK